MIMPKVLSTYDRCLIHKTSYEECKAFLRYDSLEIVRSSEIAFVN